MSAEVIGGDGRIKDRTGVAPQGVVFRAKRTSVQALGNNAWLDFKPDLKQFDPFSFYDPATGRFQPKVAGYYRLSGSTLQQPGNSTTWTYFRFAKNGGPSNGPAARSQQQQGGTPLLGGSTVMYFNGTTDYATVQVQSDNYATGGGIYGDLVAEDYSWFEAELIGVSVGLIPAPWASLPMTANWTGTSGPDPVPQYRRQPDGLIVMRGLAALTGAGFVATIGTLPAAQGVRPIKTERFLVGTFAAGGAGSWGAAYISVNTDGTITHNVQVAGSTPAAAGSWVTLAGINFPGEA